MSKLRPPVWINKRKEIHAARLAAYERKVAARRIPRTAWGCPNCGMNNKAGMEFCMVRFQPPPAPPTATLCTTPVELITLTRVNVDALSRVTPTPQICPNQHAPVPKSEGPVAARPVLTDVGAPWDVHEILQVSTTCGGSGGGNAHDGQATHTHICRMCLVTWSGVLFGCPTPAKPTLGACSPPAF